MLRPVAIDTGSCRCESFLPPPDDLEQIAPIHLTGTKGEWGPRKNAEDIGDIGVTNKYGTWGCRKWMDMVITSPIYDHIHWENDENPGFCGKLFIFRESPQSWINCSRATNNCHLLKDPAAPLGASAAQPCSTKISGRRPKVGEGCQQKDACPISGHGPSTGIFGGSSNRKTLLAYEKFVSPPTFSHSSRAASIAVIRLQHSPAIILSY